MTSLWARVLQTFNFAFHLLHLRSGRRVDAVVCMAMTGLVIRLQMGLGTTQVPASTLVRVRHAWYRASCSQGLVKFGSAARHRPPMRLIGTRTQLSLRPIIGKNERRNSTGTFLCG